MLSSAAAAQGINKVYYMAVKIQNRADTKLNWETNNPILAMGEIGYDTDSNAIKIGNGVDRWLVLPYITNANGMTPPVITTVQRDAIPAPTLGLTIFNSDTLSLESYNGYGWSVPGGDIQWDGGSAFLAGGTIIDGGYA
jgi:hypothetical protein